MKITDQFPMLYVAVSDLLADVEKFDNYKGRVWYRPSTWKKPKPPRRRICIELELRLYEYDQYSFGLVNALSQVFIELGYENGCYPLDDMCPTWEQIDEGHWGGNLGIRRRALLRELHRYLSDMEFGAVTPSHDKVREVLP